MLTALSKCGADLLILLTLHLYSVRPGVSGKMAASLLSGSSAVSLQHCLTKSVPITHLKKTPEIPVLKPSILTFRAFFPFS